MKNLIFFAVFCFSVSTFAVSPNHSVAINSAFEKDLKANCQTQRQGVNAYAVACTQKSFEADFAVSIENDRINGTGTWDSYGFCNVEGSLQNDHTVVVKTSCFSNQG